MKKISNKDVTDSIVIRTIVNEASREVHLSAMRWEQGAHHPINGVRPIKGMHLWGLKVSGFMCGFDAMFIGFERARYEGQINMNEDELVAALRGVKKVNAAMREHMPKTIGEALIAMADGLGAEFACHVVGEASSSTYAENKWERLAFYREALRIDGIVASWVEADRQARAAKIAAE